VGKGIDCDIDVGGAKAAVRVLMMFVRVELWEMIGHGVAAVSFVEGAVLDLFVWNEYERCDGRLLTRM
jgi:hypothetical protein